MFSFRKIKFSCRVDSVTRAVGFTCNDAATEVMKKPGILYHYPCPDGAFAALAAHLYFSSLPITPLYFPNTVYSPIRYIASSTQAICFLFI